MDTSLVAERATLITLCTPPVQEGYRKGTVGVQEWYRRGKVGVQGKEEEEEGKHPLLYHSCTPTVPLLYPSCTPPVPLLYPYCTKTKMRRRRRENNRNVVEGKQ